MGETPADNIVMTPKCKTANSTTLIIERKQVLQNNVNGNAHVAGGDHKGIVINKEAQSDAQAETPAQLSLQFRVFLVNAQTGRHTQESRTLQFWFVPLLPEAVQAHVAQDFFKELVSPQEFPRDYVGFIKKIMKLMQRRYTEIRRIEIELRQLEDVVNPPARPMAADEVSPGQQIELTEEKVLELIESAYPNPITIQEIAKEHGWEEELVAEHLHQLQVKGLVKPMDHGAFTRQGHADTEIQIVKNMPTMVSAKQPTIAVITAQYCEKLAVDAMLENRETFVRYTTVGESNVYTLGNIGEHRVVCTKLPTVGHTREAMTAAGNTTTRLLGTFQKVDYVLLVGVGGGVPHYTDYSKHVRLGDVVVSAATPSHKYVYTYCGFVKPNAEESFDFETKEYNPPNTILQEIAAKLKNEEEGSATWQKYMNEGLKTLQSNETEHDFRKPDSESDKLYMSIGEHDVIEVAHPSPAEGIEKRKEGNCRIHLGPVASGRKISREDTLRQLFSAKYGAIAYDSEFDAVVESVLGNCRESFAVIRGMADYKDGTRRSEWQPFASLAAASVMKALICGLDISSD